MYMYVLLFIYTKYLNIREIADLSTNVKKCIIILKLNISRTS